MGEGGVGRVEEPPRYPRAGIPAAVSPRRPAEGGQAPRPAPRAAEPPFPAEQPEQRPSPTSQPGPLTRRGPPGPRWLCPHKTDPVSQLPVGPSLVPLQRPPTRNPTPRKNLGVRP